MAKKILIVDDDLNILDAVSTLLELEGYEIRTVSEGEKVIKTVSEFDPDLILLDVLLGGLDGRDICARLKNNKNTKHIPVIMISAHPSAKNRIKSYGADSFLAKPFNSVQLLSSVSKFTGS